MYVLVACSLMKPFECREVSLPQCIPLEWNRQREVVMNTKMKMKKENMKEKKQVPVSFLNIS